MTAETAPADKLIGKVLADRYQILHRLGEGAMGIVYKARHVKVGRTFAVKVLHARLLEDSKVAQRFEREAELAGRLRHANVVGVVDVGEIDGLRYMVMDFAEGPDLAQLLAEAPMPAPRIIHLVRQMLEGLYHAHEQGLIHRDFKPENVIIEHDTHGAEMPRIVDFGIAILRDGGDSVDAQGRLTTNGLVLGTPHYMAPEQAVADPIDHRIDLFALGIVIYEMLSGRLPFDGRGAEVARANLLLDPPPIVQRVPYLEVDPLLEAFARCLMAKKPKARPSSAKAAREILDLIDRDRPVAAAVLGVPPELAARPPLETTQLSPPRASPYVAPGPDPTRRLRATPSPNEPFPPPVLAIAPSRPPIRPAPEVMAPAPSTAFTVPRPVESLPIPKAAIQHETSVRAPLSWPGTPIMPRRQPLIIAGTAIGLIGIVALLLGRTGADPAAPDDRVASTSSVPSATSPGTAASAAPPIASEPQPAPASPPAAAPPTTIIEPPPSEPVRRAVGQPTTAGAGATDARASTRRLVPREVKPREPRTGDVRAHKPRPSEDVVVITDDDPAPERRIPTGAPAIGAPATGAPATGAPATGAPATGAATTGPRAIAKPVSEPAPGAEISAAALSKLWSDVGIQLGKLPNDKNQELWRRYELMRHDSLMSASPAQRDQAAAELRRISAEASRLEH